jgi:hypothetical protein
MVFDCKVSKLKSPQCAHTAKVVAVRAFAVASLVATCLFPAVSQVPATHDPEQYGPYNGTFLADGLGLTEPITNTKDSVLRANSPWTITCWFKGNEPVTQRELIAGFGETSSEYPRYLAVDKGRVVLWMGSSNEISAPFSDATSWHLIGASFREGHVTLFVDGKSVASGELAVGAAEPIIKLAPPVVVTPAGRHFGGQIANFVLLRQAVTPAEMERLAQAHPNFELLRFEEGSKPWPFQTRGQAGYRAPQDPSTMPVSKEPFSAPVAKKRSPKGASLILGQPGMWTFNDGWRLREAPKVKQSGAEISRIGYISTDWMHATVPGTVLTSMVDDGIYPDPDYGLNNMAIPESLNRQDYWYRNEFTAPALDSFGTSKHVEICFEGINYKAEVWLNGHIRGFTKGAFLRASFDVTNLLKPGEKNVLAVRISPPPHPGIPQEQSILGGPGENGGSMELDGPTFLATEGWDWIPAIRDRNSGIWQPVVLRVTRGLRMGDAQVVTSFPNHNTDHAAVEINVPVINDSTQPLQATLHASMEQLRLTKTVTLPPGESLIRLTPAEFAQLNLDHPRLWWPNGYGSPELYHLDLTLTATGSSVASDNKAIRFGVREISYELSLMDASGRLRRMEYFPTQSRGAANPVVDVSHEGMIEIPSADAAALHIPEEKRDRYPYQSHVASVAKGAESSPSLLPLAEAGPAPYLVIKVNGVRIAVRGGNWGMDDSRKRVSREHLEPFFRLDREAHLNMIRNWVGQDTEEVFYDLADENGMLVWNDFWESTQNYNIEAQDPQLFLANAADTIKHFRNHPSIVLWCGRNEGVPQPILNEGLDRLTRELDGTRYYSPSSNQVNLQDSGPYSYQPPALYFAQLNRGFSVETGTPSMSTLEAFQASVPRLDQWPIDDVWAYHDWHQSGNGDVGTFMAEIESEFGAATSLEDFERKAQMLNYVDHRAIFEGMNANLWTPNSGRMLWMTQPAWPSNHWQILSSDYDTQASFYGVKKACEPVHIQLNLATFAVDLVNLTRDDLKGITATEKVYSLANVLLSSVSETKDVLKNSKLTALHLPLGEYLKKGMVIVKLELRDASGNLLSENLYWLGDQPSSYRELNQLASVPIKVQATSHVESGVLKVRVELKNTGSAVSLENKLTLLSAKTQERILPAYYSDNYISLMPGETKSIEIEAPTNTANGTPVVALRGWNTLTQTIAAK